MRDLFSRSFSSVHVHYIPLNGFGNLGNDDVVMGQTLNLSEVIKEFAIRVQQQRTKSWIRFDTKQLSLLIDYAFKHLAAQPTEPFDFGQCRRQISVPDTTEAYITGFLQCCTRGRIESIGFDHMAAALASTWLRKTIFEDERGEDLIYPSVVYTNEIRASCLNATKAFLENHLKCAFVDPNLGYKCINTKNGHASDHQNEYGMFLRRGSFVASDFDTKGFLDAINDSLHILIQRISLKGPSNRREWRRYAAGEHKKNLSTLRGAGQYPRASGRSIENDIDAGSSSSICFGCLLYNAEFKLPCGHIICARCIEDFDPRELAQREPGWFLQLDCIVCGDSSGPGWPYKARTRPKLAGVNVLSLDGGGVRSIIELVILRRLEKLTDLGLPIGRFFDLVIGSGAGGIIGLSIAAQNRSAKKTLAIFRRICKKGFVAKTLTKSAIQWVAMWFADSIYKTDAIEKTLEEVLSGPSSESLFGIQHAGCRLAVTTTVEAPLLIANYHKGGGTSHYFDSDLPLSKAARCTSAAPVYFEPATHGGQLCRDGGLKRNNPIQPTIDEARAIWGKSVMIDLALSVGTGRGAAKPPIGPSMPRWLKELVKDYFENLDGEREWTRFLNSIKSDRRLQQRSSRLNISLEDSVQPALDDIGSIDSLASQAEKYRFAENLTVQLLQYASILGSSRLQRGYLEGLADRLRASLYFFELKAIYKHEGTFDIRGTIHCRLHSVDEAGAYERLLQSTEGFGIGDPVRFHKMVNVPAGTPLRMEIRFQAQTEDENIRIDARFKGPHKLGIAISGFPRDVKSLLGSIEGTSDFSEADDESTREDPDIKFRTTVDVSEVSV